MLLHCNCALPFFKNTPEEVYSFQVPDNRPFSDREDCGCAEISVLD